MKIVSYNIDGLPEQIDLRELPLVLRPLSWVYRLIKGTALVTINDDKGKAEKMAEIARRLSESGADIICLQEDFNYHTVLESALAGYQSGTYTGGFDIKRLFKSVKWFPIPRFKADGLNIFVKDMDIVFEDIVPWKKSYGYFSHANDKLTMKGFRHYTLRKEETFIEVYIVHMDADFYHPENCPDVSKDITARKTQLNQLAQYIINNKTINPILVVGDFNSTEKYEWDRENVNNFCKILSNNRFQIKEIVPNNRIDVDRMFYIKSNDSSLQLKIKNCSFKLDYEGLSDHLPIEMEFEL